MAPDFREEFLDGIEKFNRGEFWNAHESWEKIWLEARTGSRQFIQGLIQLAAAYHHVQRGTYRGAIRLFGAALERLEKFPPLYCGIDRSEATGAAERHRAVVERLVMGSESDAIFDFPLLRLTAGAEIPPNGGW